MYQGIKKGIYITYSIVFVFFAALQYNDPDPYFWILIYMFVSIISIISVFRDINSYLLLPVILFYVTGAIYIWPENYTGITMPMSYKPEVELTRESLGLAISAFCLTTIFLLSLFERRTAEKAI
jgi:hypothetical protein